MRLGAVAVHVTGMAGLRKPLGNGARDHGVVIYDEDVRHTITFRSRHGGVGIGGRGGIRTLKPVRAADFKSAVYAIPPLARLSGTGFARADPETNAGYLKLSIYGGGTRTRTGSTWLCKPLPYQFGYAAPLMHCRPPSNGL